MDNYYCHKSQLMVIAKIMFHKEKRPFYISREIKKAIHGSSNLPFTTLIISIP